MTAGSVVVLHKDKVLMVGATSTANPCMNTYRDGRITAAKACGVGEKFKKFGRFIPGSSSAPSLMTRNFVSGEKFWVTRIDVRNNGVVFDFFTDAINDTRYIAALMIPFGAFVPSPEEALKVVREVISVDASEDTKDSGGGGQQGAPPGGKQQAAAPPRNRPPPARRLQQRRQHPRKRPHRPSSLLLHRLPTPWKSRWGKHRSRSWLLSASQSRRPKRPPRKSISTKI